MTTKVRIGTWNLENLFLQGGDYGPKTKAAYDAKLDSLASTIATIAPDVLAVQEVGDPQALEDLTGRVGGAWEVHTADPDPRGIRTGVISRLPVSHITQVRSFPTKLGGVRVDDPGTVEKAMGRPSLSLVAATPIGDVRIVSCHLKSKLLSFPGGRFNPRDENERARYAAYALFRRTAEAATVRTAATGYLDSADTRLIVIGDLNDEVEAQTTQILKGPSGSEIGTAGYDTPDEGDAQRLWNLAPRIDEDQRYSRIYRGRRELIDHIFVSHTLVGLVGDGAVRTDGSGPTPSIADLPAERRGAPASDHRPVVATFG